jgi:hypothetical protein
MADIEQEYDNVSLDERKKKKKNKKDKREIEETTTEEVFLDDFQADSQKEMKKKKKKKTDKEEIAVPASLVEEQQVAEQNEVSTKKKNKKRQRDVELTGEVDDQVLSTICRPSCFFTLLTLLQVETDTKSEYGVEIQNIKKSKKDKKNGNDTSYLPATSSHRCDYPHAEKTRVL